jgi:hypothetical protein
MRFKNQIGGLFLLGRRLAHYVGRESNGQRDHERTNAKQTTNQAEHLSFSLKRIALAAFAGLLTTAAHADTMTR